MVSPTHGNHLLRESALRRNFLIWRGFGIIASRKRLGRSLKPAGKEMERRTWPWLVRPKREKENIPRVTVREKPHSRGRRMT
jgi:hypothetical protein